MSPSGTGPTDAYATRNLDMVQQDLEGVLLRQWSLSRVFPVKFVADEWDNESDENVTEAVTLTLT